MSTNKKINNMKTTSRIFILCTILLSTIQAYSQCETYLQKAEMYAKQSDCENAKKWYKAYKVCKPNATGIDEKIAACGKTQAVSSPGSSTFTVRGVPFEFIFVPGGTFTMGATAEQGSDAYDSEKPAHKVTLSSYSIGKYPVTQAQWKAVMGSNPSYFKGDNLPVERVSWEDVQEFIQKLNTLTGKNFRLPTEAEWEYAARGGNKSKGYKYSGSNNLDEVAWYGDNSGGKTHPVGTKAPNELGIYDMSGNVWEWCSDWYGEYSHTAQSNPTGPSSGSLRVLRGGSWNRDAGDCRVSLRTDSTPTCRSFNIGFRLAHSSH
jgi:formylglycine-generating enzyme required for sulfatase activity